MKLMRLIGVTPYREPIEDTTLISRVVDELEQRRPFFSAMVTRAVKLNHPVMLSAEEVSDLYLAQDYYYQRLFEAYERIEDLEGRINTMIDAKLS